MSQNTHEPSKRDRLKPLELVGFSAVLAVFAGVIMGITTRDFLLRVPVAAIAVFIVSLLALALLSLSMKPNPEDIAMRDDAAKLARDAENNGS